MLMSRRIISHSIVHCDLVIQQSIKEWLKFGLGSSLVFCIGKMIDGATINTKGRFEPEIDSCVGFVWATSKKVISLAIVLIH